MPADSVTPPGRGPSRRRLAEPARPAWVRARADAPWLAVAAVCVGAFMGQLDASIVSLALPTIRDDLHTSLGGVEWVSLVYLLALVGSVVLMGRLADAVGRKLLYLEGFALFTLASLACSLAPDLGVLLLARAVQGVGAAMLQANSIALVTAAVPRHQLGRAIGIQGAAQAVGLAAGPGLGGLLVHAGGWRLVFVVNLPAGIVGIGLAWLLLPRSRDLHRGGPILDVGLLRRVEVARGLVTGLLSYLVLFGVLFVVPFYLENGRGLSTDQAGLQLTILPLALAVAAPLAGRQVDRRGARWVMTGGLLLLAAALGAAAAWRGGTVPRLAELAAAGAGLGAVIPANNAAVMGAAPPDRAGLAGGLLNMTRGIGTALGVVVAAGVFGAVAGAHPATSGPGQEAAANGFGAACAVLASVALVAAALGAVRRRAAPAV